MQLRLDHTQRLNLHALLGAQRADVATIRAIWRIQDKIALDDEEEKAIGLKRDFVAGHERTLWNPALSLPPKEFEFTDAEVARIKAAIVTWDGYSVATDRRWLEPLIETLFSVEPQKQSAPKLSLYRPISKGRPTLGRAAGTVTRASRPCGDMLVAEEDLAGPVSGRA